MIIMNGDEMLKMICQRLDNIDDKLKENDKKLLWLCTHTAKTETRLGHIKEDIAEIKDHIEKHGDRLDEFESRVSIVEGKVIMTAIVITAVLSLFINMVI